MLSVWALGCALFSAADPYAAYARGDYKEAFEGFAQLQSKAPKDVSLMLNMGATLYRLEDYAAAERIFAMAATQGSPTERQQAHYDMGNNAFRQEHLDQSIQHFEAALALDPNDEDARHNLEVVRRALASSPPADANTQHSPDGSPEQSDAGAGQATGDGQADPHGQGSGEHGAASEGASGSATDSTPDPRPADAARPDAGGTAQPDAERPPSAAPQGAAGEAPAPRGDETAPDAAAGRDRSAAAKGRPAPHNDRRAEGGHGAAAPTGEAGAMTRAQAEGLLEAIGEVRPPHRPPEGTPERRDAGGKDY